MALVGGAVNVSTPVAALTLTHEGAVFPVPFEAVPREYPDAGVPPD